MYQEAIAYEKIPNNALRGAVLKELKYHHKHDQIIRGRYRVRFISSISMDMRCGCNIGRNLQMTNDSMEGV